MPPAAPCGRRDHACQSDYIATVDNIAGFPFIIDAKDPATQLVESAESDRFVAPQRGSPASSSEDGGGSHLATTGLLCALNRRARAAQSATRGCDATIGARQRLW